MWSTYIVYTQIWNSQRIKSQYWKNIGRSYHFLYLTCIFRSRRTIETLRTQRCEAMRSKQNKGFCWQVSHSDLAVYPQGLTEDCSMGPKAANRGPGESALTRHVLLCLSKKKPGTTQRCCRALKVSGGKPDQHSLGDGSSSYWCLLYSSV